MKHLIFISNESKSTLLGIMCIYAKLMTTIDMNKWKLWLVIPKGKQDYINSIIANCINLDMLKIVEAETSNEDIYFVQLGMIKIFENINNSDFVVYLDYDHIINKPEIIEHLSSSSISVSSEEKDYPTQNSLNINKHVNISIIFGNGNKIKKIGKEWLETYINCMENVDYRYRTEISFYLAAKKSGIELKPCSTSIQANFFSPYPDCAFFHYGGDSKNSKILKNILEDTVNKYEKLTRYVIGQVNEKLSSILTGILTKQPNNVATADAKERRG